jgi:hypothetical protein
LQEVNDQTVHDLLIIHTVTETGAGHPDERDHPVAVLVKDVVLGVVITGEQHDLRVRHEHVVALDEGLHGVLPVRWHP